MAKVLGFPIDDYDRSQLDIMTDFQLNETYFEDIDVVCYENVSDFFNELNDDDVDTKTKWWKIVNID